MRYVKKPIVIEAVRWNGPADGAVVKLQEWGAPVEPGGGADYESDAWDAPAWPLFIPTLEGRMRVSLGDWIIKGVKGEFYPIKDEIFRETYEPYFDGSDVVA